MPKRTKDFPEQLNFLAGRGVTEQLLAVAYFRGEGATYAGPARDFVATGYRLFLASLDEKERKRFDEILANVKISRGEIASPRYLRKKRG
jgi:hypothetical protein